MLQFGGHHGWLGLADGPARVLDSHSDTRPSLEATDKGTRVEAVMNEEDAILFGETAYGPTPATNGSFWQ